MISRLTASLDFHAQALSLRAERQRAIAKPERYAGLVKQKFVSSTVPSQTNLDSNSVDMDRERAAFADNAVKYESTLRFINGSVRTMLDAMKSHNQA